MNFTKKAFAEIVGKITKSEAKAEQAMEALGARGGDYWAARNVLSDPRMFTELQARKGLELLGDPPVAPPVPVTTTPPAILRTSVLGGSPSEDPEPVRARAHWSHDWWAAIVFGAIGVVVGILIAQWAISLVDTRWGWLTTILSGMVGIGIVLAINGVAMLGLQAIRRRHNYPYEPVRGSNAPEEV